MDPVTESSDRLASDFRWESASDDQCAVAVHTVEAHAWWEPFALAHF
jgi:hypothetical protein